MVRFLLHSISCFFSRALDTTPLLFSVTSRGTLISGLREPARADLCGSVMGATGGEYPDLSMIVSTVLRSQGEKVSSPAWADKRKWPRLYHCRTQLRRQYFPFEVMGLEAWRRCFIMSCKSLSAFSP